MPYKKTSDLPKGVKDHLPAHAQKIWMEVFNKAYHEYANPAKRDNPHDSQDEVAAKVAWSVVEKSYKKVGDKWVKRG